MSTAVGVKCNSIVLHGCSCQRLHLLTPADCIQICSPRVQVSSRHYTLLTSFVRRQMSRLVSDLRSSSSLSLIVSRTRLSTVGDQVFPVAAARVWNSLPDLVTSTPSVAFFRSRLKTHLFNISYPSPL